MHIIALISGIFVITGIVEKSEVIKFYSEIFTLIVLFLIVFIHFLKPLLVRIYIKRYLHNFWGSNIVSSKICVVNEIKIKSGWNSEIITPQEIFHLEMNEISWDKSNPFDWKLKLSIEVLERSHKIEENEENFLSFFIYNVLINVKENNVRLSTLVVNSKDDDHIEKIFYINFKRNDNKAVWSGMYPEFPFYGEWNWANKTSLAKETISIHDLDEMKKSKKSFVVPEEFFKSVVEKQIKPEKKNKEENSINKTIDSETKEAEKN